MCGLFMDMGVSSQGVATYIREESLAIFFLACNQDTNGYEFSALEAATTL